MVFLKHPHFCFETLFSTKATIRSQCQQLTFRMETKHNGDRDLFRYTTINILVKLSRNMIQYLYSIGKEHAEIKGEKTKCQHSYWP